MLGSIWDGMKSTGRFLSDIFNTPAGPNAEFIQTIANSRVSHFRDAIAKNSTITRDHAILEGRDVLARADKLGIAMGVDPDLNKDVEHAVGPGVAVRRVNHQASSIRWSAEGLENGGTPFVSAPETMGGKSSMDHYIQKLDGLCDEVEAYRADPDSLMKYQQFEVKWQLGDKRCDKKADYETIVRSARIEEEDVFRPAEYYEGQAYVTHEGHVLTKQRALEDLLGSSTQDAQPSLSAMPA